MLLHKISARNKMSDELNEMPIHSLPAGGAYGTAMVKRFIVYSQSRAGIMHTTLIAIYYTEAR